MATEIKLQPGWLTRDVVRASEQVKTWEAEREQNDKRAKSRQPEESEQKQ